MPKLANLATITNENDEELFDEINTAKRATDSDKPSKGCRYQEEVSRRKRETRQD